MRRCIRSAAPPHPPSVDSATPGEGASAFALGDNMRATFSRSVGYLFAVIAACWLAAPTLAAAQTAPTQAQISERVDQYMNAAVRFDQFSGSILVARDGQPLVSRGYGMANYELNVPNSPQTVFLIGSLTKQFTAVAIMQLQERRRLTVGDPICRYIDNCPDTWRPITIRQLLSHTSGIPNYSSLPDWDERLSHLPYTQLGFVDVFRDQPLQFAPGSNYRYSNSGYYLLGLIIERASGQTYADYVRDNIFARAGMSHSGYDDARTLQPNRAIGYVWAANTFAKAEILNMMLPFAAGSLYSTTEDMLRFDQALYGEQLLSRRSREEMFTPVLNNYGYGWVLRDIHGRSQIGHSGGISGYSAFLMRFPNERTTIIVLSNSDRTSATKVATNLAAITFGETYALPTPQLFDLMWTTIQQHDVAAAIQQYRDLRASHPDDYDFSDDTLNDLGYDLLGNGRSADAIAIFRFYTEAFPQDANAYDSLGEAYMRTNQTALAIQNYERSLALNPENANAARMLEQLRQRPAN